MKKTLVILLALVLCLCLSGTVCCEDGSGVNYKFEGGGFDTPEDAVLAYIDAWNNGDVRTALSTFAVESLVDHTDTRIILENTRLYNPTQVYLSVPANNTWIRDLEVIKRYAEVSNFLFNQYVTNNSGEYAKPNAQPVPLRTQEEIEALLTFFETPLTESWIGKIRFLEWIDPLLIDKMTSASALRAITNLADQYGADDVSALIAHIDLGDEYQGILFMECLSYGGRWFNLRTLSVQAMMMDMDQMSGGLYVFPQEEAVQLAAALLTQPDPEAKAVLKAHLESGLTGTRWSLVKAAGGNEKYIAADQIEELNGWSREEIGIWAELHFTRLGAIARTFSTDQSDRGIPATDRLYAMWVEEGNIIRFEGNLSGKGVVSGDQLVITLEDGTMLQFKKIDDCNVCKLH